MIKFEKVSKEQFIKDTKNLFPYMEEEDIIKTYDNLHLPERGSIGSAGYDFYSPLDFTLNRGDSPITIPLGIRAIMPNDVFLAIVPRSGVGFKTGVGLANQVGIIDADYQCSPNEGHIMLKLVPGFKDYVVAAGDRVVQGIFLPFCVTSDDTTTAVRTGGIGSTGK